MTNDESDQALLTAWQAGDRRAGERLVQRHFLSIYNFFRTKVGADEVEGLTQQTFLACVEARDRVRGDSFAAYLFGIARKLLLQHLRARGRSDRELPRPATLVPSPTGALAQRDEERLLLLALRSIPLELQITLELAYWEHLSGAEIAEVLDVAPGTVRSRLARAKQALRDRIEALSQSAALTRSTLDGLERWVESMRKALREPSR
jgi:RNA polymerase sigma factor (sigma-70 family)